MISLPRDWVDRWNSVTTFVPFTPAVGEVSVRGRKYAALIGDTHFWWTPTYVITLPIGVSDI